MADAVALSGPFGGINEIENEQEPNEFDFLANVELHQGWLEARHGWEVMGRKYTDTFEFTGDYSTAHNIVASTYAPAYAYMFRAYCVGAYTSRLDSGLLRFICVYREHDGTQTWNIKVRMYDEAGDIIGTEWNLTSLYGEPANAANPYTFCEVYDRVYFSNGNGIYVWSLYGGNQLDVVDFIAHPIYGSSYLWITDGIRARIVASHKDRVFYAGIPEDTLVRFSGLIPTADDLAMWADTGRGDSPAQKNSIGDTGMFYPAHLVWSEPGFPACVRHTNFWFVPDGQAITAVAEFQQSLVIMTANSLYVLNLDADGNVDVRRISGGNGCSSPRSVCTLNDGRLAWASRDGLFTFDGSKVEEQSRKVTRTWHGHGITAFPRQSADVRSALVDLKVPWFFDLERLDWSTAINYRTQGQYWLSVTTATSATVNNIILVWDYDKGRFWFHSGVELDAQSASTPGIASFDVLLTDPQVNDAVYAVTRNYAGYTSTDGDRLARYGAQLCSYGGEYDEVIEGKGSVYACRFPMLAVSRRVGLGEGAQIVSRTARLRMYARHNHDLYSEASSEKPRLIAFPEGASFDQWRSSTDSTKLQEATWNLSGWPEAGGSGEGAGTLATVSSWQSRSFWQATSGASTAFNVWDSTTALNSTLYPTCIWQSIEPYDKGIPIPAWSCHWIRMCLFESPKTHGHLIRLLSWAVFVEVRGRDSKA